MRWVTRGPRPSVDTVVRAGFATALLISMIVGILAYASIVGFVDANDRLQRSNLALAKLEMLRDSFAGAEIAGLRYMATADEKHLEFYGARTSAIDQMLAELRGLIAEEPPQQARFQTLEWSIQAALVQSREGIDLRKVEAGVAETSVRQTNRANDLSRLVRETFSEMAHEEMRLSSLRDMEEDEIAERTILISGVGVLVTFLIGVLAVLVLSRDIAKRKRVEKVLRDSEERLRLIAANSPDMMFHQDRHLRYTWAVNSPLGDDAVGRTDVEVLGPEAAAELEPIKREVLETGVGIRTEVHLVIDGKERYYDVVYQPGRDCEGSVNGIYGYARDITDRKQRERQAICSQRLEMAGVMAGHVAHNFNNLLTPLTAYPEILKMWFPEDQRVAPVCDTMLAAARHMVDITSDMMVLAKLGILDQQPTDLNQLVQQSLAGTAIFPATLKLVVDLSPDLLPVNASHILLARALTNLLAHARESMQDVGILTVRTENLRVAQPFGRRIRVQPGEYVHLSVADSGRSIPAEIQDRILEPFLGTRPGEGWSGDGLRLAIVEAIVSDHQGNMDLESAVGKGSTFHVYLPAWRQPVVEV